MHTSEPRALPRLVMSVMKLGLVLGLSVSAGCGSDTTGPSGAEKDGYWKLQLNHEAITMSLTAPSNQLQLQAVPLTARGDTIATTNRVQYISNDSSVIVDSTGLLTARLAQIGVTVIATLAVPNEHGQQVTLTDTALVNVNTPSSVPDFAALRIATPGDSATFSSVVGLDGMTVTAFDASNAQLPTSDSYNVVCRSSDPDVVDFGNQPFNNFALGILARIPGTAMITCSATIYGVRKADSVQVRIGRPLYGLIKVITTPVVAGPPDVVLSADLIRIGVGGVIQWDNNSGDTVDLVFDDSLAPQSVPASEIILGSGILGIRCLNPTQCHVPTNAGNVLLLPKVGNFTGGVGRDFRKFIAAGTYPFHSVRYPTVMGTIVVQ